MCALGARNTSWSESYNFGPAENCGHVCELSDSDVVRDELDLIFRQGFIYRGTMV